MDWAQWLATVLAALLGSVVGSLSTVGVQWVRQRVERTERRQDRRDDFQRTTIMELQESVSRVIDAYVEARNAEAPSPIPRGPSRCAPTASRQSPAPSTG